MKVFIIGNKLMVDFKFLLVQVVEILDFKVKSLIQLFEIFIFLIVLLVLCNRKIYLIINWNSNTNY